MLRIALKVISIAPYFGMFMITITAKVAKAITSANLPDDDLKIAMFFI